MLSEQVCVLYNGIKCSSKSFRCTSKAFTLTMYNRLPWYAEIRDFVKSTKLLRQENYKIIVLSPTVTFTTINRSS